MGHLIVHILAGVPLVFNGNLHVLNLLYLPLVGVFVRVRQAVLREVPYCDLIVLYHAHNHSLHLLQLLVIPGQVLFVVAEN